MISSRDPLQYMQFLDENETKDDENGAHEKSASSDYGAKTAEGLKPASIVQEVEGVLTEEEDCCSSKPVDNHTSLSAIDEDLKDLDGESIDLANFDSIFEDALWEIELTDSVSFTFQLLDLLPYLILELEPPPPQKLYLSL